MSGYQWQAVRRTRSERVIACRDYTLTLGERTLVMGILNVTPDSFSDGGRYQAVELAVKRAFEMVEEGADIIDIGGESTRPGSQEVSAEEELRRILPVIRALREAGLSVPISVDTYKAEVAKQAVHAGASILNDIWGGIRDAAMLTVAAAERVPIVLMHNREQLDYDDFLPDVIADLQQMVSRAAEAGVADENIILDPGIGFAKTREQNLLLMNHLDQIVRLGYPVLLGTSRKSMIRLTLGLPSDQLIGGTAATVALGVAQGCSIVRVHDVAEMRKTVQMTDAIVGQTDGGEPS